MEENDLYIKLEKCKWKMREVEFLGVVIEKDRIKMEKQKMKIVLKWPISKLVKDIQKFLRLANYYRQFIKDFAKITRLLYELTRKEQKWEQKIRQKKSFEELKKRFTIKLMLVVPDLDRKIRMEVNALDFVIEGVLSIECENRRWRPVVYLSKSLNKTEKNYEIHNKEILAVIMRLEVWKHLLKDTKLKFKVWTNYKNLEYFIKVQKLNRRQTRQTLYLFRFDFTLKHVLGKRIDKTNSLSRRIDWKVEFKNSNKNQKLIKKEQVRKIIEVVVKGLETMLIEKIKRAREKDKEIVRVVEEMKKVGMRNLRGDEQKIKRDLVLKERKVYIPKNIENEYNPVIL